MSRRGLSHGADAVGRVAGAEVSGVLRSVMVNAYQAGWTCCSHTGRRGGDFAKAHQAGWA